MLGRGSDMLVICCDACSPNSKPRTRALREALRFPLPLTRKHMFGAAGWTRLAIGYFGRQSLF